MTRPARCPAAAFVAGAASAPSARPELLVPPAPDAPAASNVRPALLAPRARLATAALVALALAGGCAGRSPPPAPPPSRRAPPALLALAVEGQRVAHESLEAVRQAQRGLTKVLAVALRASAAVWLASHEGCPSADELLDRSHPTAAHASATDAWEAPFRITCRGDDAEVRSAGPDGVFSTDDDVVASDRE